MKGKSFLNIRDGHGELEVNLIVKLIEDFLPEHNLNLLLSTQVSSGRALLSSIIVQVVLMEGLLTLKFRFLSYILFKFYRKIMKIYDKLKNMDFTIQNGMVF